MIGLIIQFFLALFATLGFCIIFRVPMKLMLPCVIVGALGWIAYKIVMFYYVSPVLACFIGSCLVGLLSDICSRLFKEAATIFIIPGILCLVPGSNIFQTMAALLSSNFDDAASIGTQTLLMAGAIAAGLLVIGTVSNVIYSMVKKTVSKAG